MYTYGPSSKGTVRKCNWMSTQETVALAVASIPKADHLDLAIFANCKSNILLERLSYTDIIPRYRDLFTIIVPNGII